MLKTFPIAPLFMETLALYERRSRSTNGSAIAEGSCRRSSRCRTRTRCGHPPGLIRAPHRGDPADDGAPVDDGHGERTREGRPPGVVRGRGVRPAKVVPDLIIVRGEEAYRAARILGDRSIDPRDRRPGARHLDLGELDKARAGSTRPAPSRQRPRHRCAAAAATWRGWPRGGGRRSRNAAPYGPGAEDRHRPGSSGCPVRDAGPVRAARLRPRCGDQRRRAAWHCR